MSDVNLVYIERPLRVASRPRCVVAVLPCPVTSGLLGSVFVRVVRIDQCVLMSFSVGSQYFHLTYSMLCISNIARSSSSLATMASKLKRAAVSGECST